MKLKRSKDKGKQRLWSSWIQYSKMSLFYEIVLYDSIAPVSSVQLLCSLCVQPVIWQFITLTRFITYQTYMPAISMTVTYDICVCYLVNTYIFQSTIVVSVLCTYCLYWLCPHRIQWIQRSIDISSHMYSLKLDNRITCYF